jgi:hypothetical protein
MAAHTRSNPGFFVCDLESPEAPAAFGGDLRIKPGFELNTVEFADIPLSTNQAVLSFNDGFILFVFFNFHFFYFYRAELLHTASLFQPTKCLL